VNPPSSVHTLTKPKKGATTLISSFELQCLNNYHTKDLLLSALAHLLWDDNQAQLPEVEKTLCAATNEAWEEY
jgi:hypothetical protein